MLVIDVDAETEWHLRRALARYEQLLRADGGYPSVGLVEIQRTLTLSVTRRQGGSCGDTSSAFVDDGFVSQSLFTIPQVALKTALSERTIEREISDGRLRVVKVRGARRIDGRDLEEYLDELRTKGTS